MDGGGYGAVGAEKYVIADIYGTGVQYGKIKIGVAVVTEFGKNAVVKINRALKHESFPVIWQELIQQIFPQGFVLVVGIIVLS